MENQKENAVPGKPGHQRDIPPEAYDDPANKKKDDKPGKHIENTDAILGDVHPTNRNGTSQEEHNADKED